MHDWIGSYGTTYGLFLKIVKVLKDGEAPSNDTCNNMRNNKLQLALLKAEITRRQFLQ